MVAALAYPRGASGKIIRRASVRIAENQSGVIARQHRWRQRRLGVKLGVIGISGGSSTYAIITRCYHLYTVSLACLSRTASGNHSSNVAPWRMAA